LMPFRRREEPQIQGNRRKTRQINLARHPRLAIPDRVVPRQKPAIPDKAARHPRLAILAKAARRKKVGNRRRTANLARVAKPF
jgi:hypothetical protein